MRRNRAIPGLTISSDYTRDETKRGSLGFEFSSTKLKSLLGGLGDLHTYTFILIDCIVIFVALFV